MTLPVNALILVAVINNLQDYEIARLLGWYRIPLKTSPKVVQVDYLAFYQTAAFRGRQWMIEFVAPVRGHELVTRADLFQSDPDHPRANDMYYKIFLGPLEKLPSPIRAEKWKRITFFYTTGEYLNQAKTINQLVVHTDERRSLWQALRERAETSQYHTESLPDLQLNPELLATLLGLSDPNLDG
jgi:hypothetical protein